MNDSSIFDKLTLFQSKLEQQGGASDGDMELLNQAIQEIEELDTTIMGKAYSETDGDFGFLAGVSKRLY